MSLLKVLDIAGSAMSANSVLLTTTASNLANAGSVSSSENKIYKERVPIFAAVMADACQDAYSQNAEAVPVKVLGIVEKQTVAKKEYNPGHPQADADGFIYMPDVNQIEQMTNSIIASQSYQINAELANTIKDLAAKTLALGQG